MIQICVRVPNWLGDSVMARPFVATVARLYPDAELLLLAHRRVADLWRAWPGLEVETIAPGASELAALLRTAFRLRRRAPGATGFLLTSSFASALLFVLAGARRRVGFVGDARGWLLTEPALRFPVRGRHHRSDEYLRLLGGDTVTPAVPPPFAWPPTARTAVAERLERAGLWRAPFVVAAVGAEGDARRYPLAPFGDVLADLAKALPVVLVGTPAQRSLSRRIAVRSPRITDWTGETTVPELAVLLEEAAVFVGPDSGAGHLAAAVGTATVVIFGAGDPVETGPQGAHVRILRADLWCSPCLRAVCWREDHPRECLDLVPPGLVRDTVLAALP